MENKDFKKLIETARQVMSTDETLTEEKLLLEHDVKRWPIDVHNLMSPDAWKQHLKDYPDHENDEVIGADDEQKQSADRIANAQKAIANFVSQQQSPQSGA